MLLDCAIPTVQTTPMPASVPPAKAGSGAGGAAPQADLNALKDRLISLGEDVLEGRVDRADAAVCGQLWNTAIGAIRTALKAKEVEELEARLERLEEAIEEKDVRGRSSSWGKGSPKASGAPS